jgi:hypothetical protein
VKKLSREQRKKDREKTARGPVSTPPGGGAAQTTSDRGAALRASRPEGAAIIPFKRPAGHAALPKNRRVTAKASSAREDSDRDPPSARASRTAPRKRPGNVVLMFFGLAAIATVIVVLAQRGPNAAKETPTETVKPEAPKPREVPAAPPLERSPATMVTVGAAPEAAADPPAPAPSAQPAATVAPKPTATAGTAPAEKPITTTKPATAKPPADKPAATAKPATTKPAPPKAEEDIY